MSVFGIVCETNPIHNGHKHIIMSARELGASAVVCVMSGNTVQRGEFAIADKYTRAEALLKCGADLVLELPYPWSCSSAEKFAEAAILILRNFCDTVIFGSECGDISLLNRVAKEAASTEFRENYNARLSEGEPAARLFFDMLKNVSGCDFGSNDILGIEYIKSSINLKTELTFVTVKRVGDGYTYLAISNEAYPSAMSIRKLWHEGNTEDLEKYIPTEACELYKNAIHNGNITDTAALDLILLSFFRLHNGTDFENIAGANGGLANRICEMSHKARSMDELLKLVKTKRYTDANIRRTIMHCLSGVTKQNIDELPSETLLLAANTRGRELLAMNRKKRGFHVVTKPADLDMSLPQNILSEKIDSVFTLLLKDINSSDSFVKKGPYIK